MGTKLWSRAFAVAAIAGLTFAACGPAGPAATPAPTAAATAAPTPAPTVAKRGAGGDLKILYWQAPTILNSHQSTGTKDNDPSRLVMEPLAAFGPDGTPVAKLAAEVPTVANGGVAKDFSSVTWKLKQGVKFSDGSAFDADDVVFTFKYVCDKATGSSTFGACDGVKSVEKKDANTVIVTYDPPNAFFYQWGVGLNGPILSKNAWKDCLGDKAKTCPTDQKPIGTGPYKVKEFKQGDVVLFEINDNYREADKPFFKTVTWKGGGDATAAARALFQTGDIDYAWNLQVEASIIKPMAAASDKGVLGTTYGSSVERILLNRANPDPALGDKRSEPDTKHPFLSDIAVRRALAMATDRSQIAKEIYGDGLLGKGTCNILTAPEPMNSKNTASLDVCKFDLAAANAELDKAGWVKGADGVRSKGGVRLEIGYQTTVNAVRQKTQDVMKANWEKVGFKVTLKSFPASTFFTNTSPDGANKFFTDVEMFTNSGDPDPTSYFVSWTCSQVNGKASNWNNGGYERYCNKDYDALFDQLKKETDPAKRNDLAIKLNDQLIKDVVIIPIINRIAPSPTGYAKALKGINISPWDSEMYNIADWSK